MKYLGYFKKSSFNKMIDNQIVPLRKYSKLRFTPIWCDQEEAYSGTLNLSVKDVVSKTGSVLANEIDSYEPVMLTLADDGKWVYERVSEYTDGMTTETVAGVLVHGEILTYEGHVYALQRESRSEFGSVGVTYKLLLSCMELLGADETSELKLLIHHHRVIGIEFGGGNHAAEPNTVNLFLQRLDWFGNEIMPQALPLVVRQALQEDC